MKFISAIILIFSIYCIQIEEYDENNVKVEDIIDLKSSRCLPTDEETEEFIKKNNINYNGKIDNNIKFIAGDCSPIVLIPGIYSTKLKVKLNCKNLKKDENSMYEKIKFYCGDRVCSNDDDENENRNLWFNIGGDGFSLLKTFLESNDDADSKKYEWNNQYSACLGFFMTIFDNKDECPKIGEKKICEYSKNIKISYEGGYSDTKNNADCGVKAIENVLLTGINISPEESNIFGELVEQLSDYGYEKGFSLSGVPNDFRKFISTNQFAYDTLKYHINNMHLLTGKPVIIIAHSFGNLITLNTLKNDETLKNKVKKWISLAPPFAGATKAVDNFLHGITDFNFPIKAVNGYLRSEFEEFGQFIMLKSIPTVYELRPNSIFWKIFNTEEYKDYSDFSEAIRARIELEKNCKKNNKCDNDDIEEKSATFDKYFGDYFPSLKLSQCQYESSVGGNQEALNKKCFTEIFNIADYPSFVKASFQNTLNDTSFDIEDYYKATGNNLYYIADCDKIKDSKCIDNILPDVPCVYDSYTRELKDLINKFNKKYNKNIDRLNFPTSDEVKQIINKMISYQNEKSKIKSLDIPPVDIDIVYSSFNPTLAAELVDKDYLINKGISNKGGDGTVPTWSSLLTALKWIYDKQTKNLNQKIRLIEYCSRLANTDINLPNFKPISCQCIEGSTNVYKEDLNRCSHQFMLSDTYLFDYILDEIVKDEKIISNRKKAIENYSTSRKYLEECNTQLYYYINKNPDSQQCSSEIEITQDNFATSNNYCETKNYITMEGRKCCSVHIKGYSEEKKEFNLYYCDNIQNDDDYKNYYIKDLKEIRQFFYNEIIDVEIKCFSNYLIIGKYLLLLLFAILI